MNVGVFGTADSWYVQTLCAVGEARGHAVSRLEFSKVVARVGAARLELRYNEIDLTRLDAVLVRTMPPGSLEQVVSRMDLLAGLEHLGVRVLNPPKALECAVDKYLTTQRLSLAGIPVPMTVACEDSDQAMTAFDEFGRDVVVKPLFGSEGRGILRVTEPELAWRVFRTIERLGAVLYVQQFVDGPGFDVRILLLDGLVLAAMKRTPRPGEFRANISQHGTAAMHQPTAEERSLAIRAAEVTGSVFAGVDLMYGPSGRLYVIEVNAVPGWRGLQRTTGVMVPERLFEWLEREPSAKPGNAARCE